MLLPSIKALGLADMPFGDLFACGEDAAGAAFAEVAEKARMTLVQPEKGAPGTARS